MNFLSRKAKPTESTARDEARSIVHREIEITVERTWTTVSASTGATTGVAADMPSIPGEETVL